MSSPRSKLSSTPLKSFIEEKLVPRSKLKLTNGQSTESLESWSDEISAAQTQTTVNRRVSHLFVLPGDQEVTANLYCNFAYLYWEGCVIFSIFLW